MAAISITSELSSGSLEELKEKEKKFFFICRKGVKKRLFVDKLRDKPNEQAGVLDNC